MKEVRLALIGYGNAGRAFGRMLERKRAEIAAAYGCEVVVTAIATGTRGCLYAPRGIDLAAAEAELLRHGAFQTPCGQTTRQLIETAGYDVMAELTPISIMDGQPAIGHIEAALGRGKDVLTANKGPIAWAYKRLKALAEKNGCQFYFETTVMDGTPVFNLAAETLKLCKITAISGILNATTNYILGEMEKGISFEAAVEAGRAKGFVEADPAMDIDGWDAAAKLTALMNVLMGVELTPDRIDRRGIAGVTAQDLRAAAARGKTIKLVCEGRFENGVATGRVAPEAVDLTDALATITGAASIVSLTTDLMGTVSVLEHEHAPEIDQTAYGILSDLVRILDGRA